MNKKRFTFLLVIIMLTFSLLGYSSWIISNGNNESIISGDILNKDMISINVKYVAYTDLIVNEDSNKLTVYDDQTDITQSFTVNNPDTYNKINNLISREGLSFKLDQTGGQNSENSSGTFKYYINITKAIKTSTSCGSTTYSGAYTIYKVSITKSANTEYFNTDIVDVIKIKKNTSIPKTYLDKIINNNSNYSFLGFMNSLVDGTPGNSLLPIDTKFSQNIDIYACFNKKDAVGLPTGNLTKEIVNANSTINIYSGNSNKNLNVKNDTTYFSQLNTVFIGENESIEIREGASINFCLNNGKQFSESTLNTDKQLTSDPFNSKHNIQYKIILTSDIIINGEMLIGGTIGGGSNNDTQGNINNAFVCLDLNGHNIIVNGTLKSYGVIVDSVGSGSVKVNSSGFLQSLAVIYDYKGGKSTSNQADAKICPFQIYNIPYLRCTLEFNGTSNEWGTFVCVVRIHTSSYSSTNVELNLLGSNNCLFTPESSSGQIIVKNNEIKELSKDNTLKDYTFDIRTQFNFYNCDIKLSNLKINAGATINTQELSFPISSFFDINLYNSSFTFEQSISFMPGSSLYVDENSSIILSYNSSRSATISVIDQPVYSYNFTDGNSLNKSSSINASNVSVAKLFWENANLWKYYNKSQILCNGTLYFKSGNSNPYKIAGQFNFNKIGYIGTNGIKNSINSNFPFKTLKSVGCNIITYDYDFIPGIYSGSGANNNYKGYARPLVSYDEAYVYDGSNEMIGTFDFNSGIFECNNKSYILNAGTAMNDKTITIEECTINLDHTVTTSSGTFAYYCNIFMPVTISSDKNTCTISKMTNSSSNTHNISYNNTLNCWVKAHD